jgi:hypothetical protein
MRRAMKMPLIKNAHKNASQKGCKIVFPEILILEMEIIIHQRKALSLEQKHE